MRLGYRAFGQYYNRKSVLLRLCNQRKQEINQPFRAEKIKKQTISALKNFNLQIGILFETSSK